MTHAVIIRMHYPENSAKFEWRFSYFQSMVLPRLLNQKNKNFDICIWCNKWHEDRFKKLSPRIKTFGIKTEAEGYIKPGYEKKVGKYHVDFMEWDKVVGLDKYDIQTALDSDDLILRYDFIDRIEQECAKETGSLHLSFQPFMFHVKRLQMYKCPLKYHNGHGSPFYSIYQPNKENYIFAYHDSHFKISNYVKKSIIIPFGYCTFSIHDNNASTYLYKNSVKL
jgi:hypothetical protein